MTPVRVHQSRPFHSLEIGILSFDQDGTQSLTGRFLVEAVEARGHRASVLPSAGGGAIEQALAAVEENRVGAILVTLPAAFDSAAPLAAHIEACLRHTLPGFGELLRSLLWQQSGSAALSLVATAGQLERGTWLFAFPGSVSVAKLAWERLIAPEVGLLIASDHSEGREGSR